MNNILSDIAIIGLGAMGRNLALNCASHQIRCSVYNRTSEVTTQFIDSLHSSEHRSYIFGYTDIAALLSSLKKPRNVIVLVKAGEVTDHVIDMLASHLDEGDCIIDCGNSHWKDGARRQKALQNSGISYVTCGISGGWSGALAGPSLMPSGDKNTVHRLIELLSPIAARDFSHHACIGYIGSSSSGHFVKMVHNGIEYALMQLCAEIYDMLRHEGYTNHAISDLFAQINDGKSGGYLVEITQRILQYPHPHEALLDIIRPVAHAKGTGLWTVQSALEMGMPCGILHAGLEARVLSNYRQINVAFPSNRQTLDHVTLEMVHTMRRLFETTALLTYIQGLELIHSASERYQWGVDIQEVLRVWQGGCIIRSGLITDLAHYKQLIPALSYHSLIRNFQLHVPTPVIDAARNYLLTLTSSYLPQNLVQAQRDYFGSHTFERVDREGVFTDTWGQL